MAKPTTIRIPEDLLKEVDQLVKDLNLDRSAYLREVLRKGFSLDRQERLLKDYERGELSLMEVCQELKEIGDFPIIMLTAKYSEEERVAGFALGATPQWPFSATARPSWLPD